MRRGRGHVEHIAGAELALGAVIHLQCHASRLDDADVFDLARVRARERLHVDRPAPARLEGAATDGVTVEVDQRHLAFVVGELAYFIRGLEPLACELCHCVLLGRVGEGLDAVAASKTNVQIAANRQGP